MPDHPFRFATLFVTTALAGASARATPELGFDFDAVTDLARGALVGENVNVAVSGFEIRLLHRGSPVYHQAFGNWQLDKLANVDSSTKTMSGSLLMSLTENSVVPFSLDSKLADFLPAFNTNDKRDITIRQAFSHSSGLPGNSSVQSLPDISLQQAANFIATLPMENGPPGENFSYGGASMHAAGAAMEVAGGDSFVNLFNARIAGPLGLTQTRFVIASQTNPRVAGGIESTASEFGTFMETLRNGGVHDGTRILSQASVDSLFTRQTDPDIRLIFSPLPGVTDYGVGVWLDQRDAAGNLIGATAAGARGFTSFIDFDDEVTGVFATDRTSASNIRQLDLLIRAAVEDAVRHPAVIGDADRNDAVDFSDLLTLARNFGTLRRDNRWRDGDFTGDGRVSFDDLLGLARNYGRMFEPDWILAQTILPEPSAALGIACVFAIGGVRVCRGRRRETA